MPTVLPSPSPPLTRIMNTRIVLANRPAEGPIPPNTFKQEQKPVPKKEDLKDGEVIVRVMWLSLVSSANACTMRI